MSEAAAHAEEYTTLGLPHRKVGFWTFIGSECMFFGSLIGTYLAYRGKSLQGPFPEETFSVLVTSISTFTLLTSSLAMVLALHYVQVGSRRLAGFWLLATALLGLLFLGLVLSTMGCRVLGGTRRKIGIRPRPCTVRATC